MKKRILIFVIAALLAFFAAGCSNSGSSASQEPTPTATAEPTLAPTPTEAPTPIPTQAPAPTADIAGVSSDSGYVNDILGFSIPYPDGYTALTQDQIDSIMAQVIDQIKSSITDSDLAEKAISQSVPKAMAFKHPLTYADGFNASFNLIISELPAGTPSDIMAIVTAAIQMAGSQDTSLQYGEPSSVQIGGKDFATVDMAQNINGTDVTERQYYFMKDNYLVIITLGADNEDDFGELDNMVQAIQFAQ